MIKNNRVIVQGYPIEGLYALCTATNEDLVEVAAVASLQPWHARLGHINYHGIKKMGKKVLSTELHAKMQIYHMCAKLALRAKKL